jgi:hypothetical protein
MGSLITTTGENGWSNELIDGGVAFTIRIWMKGNIWEMEQQGINTNTASCITTT